MFPTSVEIIGNGTGVVAAGHGLSSAPRVLSVLSLIPIVGVGLVVMVRLLALSVGLPDIQDTPGLDTRKILATISVSLGCTFLIASATRTLLTHIGFPTRAWSAPGGEDRMVPT
jgi:hypothetical protein